MSSENHHHFNVVMSCEGCSNAIKRALARLGSDVSKVEVSLEKQTVDVYSKLPFETILEKIKKTGKEVKSGETL
ncbi:LAFE_0G02630g1_1 [Lachancea fermentati]|uniref:LAFE_0G02630g1_1 n=1 Tax=Lachancea fermentati TaxID=4955 RepID=A0A1G4MGT7_LACFM|nr:LAFE_0G02630g1_1 [Lachancea fermentati]